MNNYGPKINAALASLNFNSLKVIQEETLENFKVNDELVLIAPTGSGKTLAFLLPILDNLKTEKITQAIIIAPARELAIQIEQVFKSMKTGFKINCCYGGHNVKTELNNLTDTPHVIVGTPGRIADHLRRASINNKLVKTLVLDEFDKALEMGFEKDISFIVEELFNVEKRLLVSATEKETLPDYVKMSNPITLTYIGDKRNEGQLETYLVRANSDDKLDALKDLIQKIGHEPTIIFCNHRDAVERIGDLLWDANIPVGVFHGALKQEHRERELIKLRNKSSNILITTDLASRGIDIPSIKNVVHYQLPTKEDAFIHRNGRTARMEANGTSYLLLKENEEIPVFVAKDIETISLQSLKDQNTETEYETLYLNLGKKNKINKVDIVGLFYKKGGLKGDELGLIEVLDFCAYIAVNRKKARTVIQKLKPEKIKKQSFMLAVSR